MEGHEGLNLQTFLQSSKSYESSLLECLEQIEQQLASKLEREGRMRHALSSAVTAPVTTVLFRSPYFQDAKGQHAPPLPAEMEANDLLDILDPYEVKTVWTKRQDKLLKDVVTKRKRELRSVELIQKKRSLDKQQKDLRNFLEVLTNHASDETENVLTQLQNSSISTPITLPDTLTSSSAKEFCEKLLSEITENLAKLNKDITEVSDLSTSYPVEKLTDYELKKYDWFDIVSKNVRLKRHGFDGCRIRYLNFLAPHLKSAASWTQPDLRRLLFLVEQHGEHNWDVIAQEIPGRTAFACCQQYVKFQKESPEENRLRRLFFAPEDVIRLIHAYHVTQGVWRLIYPLVPGKSRLACKRYWEANLDPNANRNAWTEREMNILRNFAGNKKGISQRISKLKTALPERSSYDINHVFYGMFKRAPDGKWEEKGGYLPNTESREQKTALVLKLMDHVLSTVTEPLRDDLTVSMEELVTAPEVIIPTRRFLRELDLLHPCQREVADNDVRHVPRNLSENDHHLVEMFSAPVIEKMRPLGRKRKGNVFGSIPADLQVLTMEGKRDAIKSVLAKSDAEINDSVVLIPPSLATIGAFVKLKELLSGTCLMVEEKIHETCEAEDLTEMQRRVESLFLTTELLRLTVRQHVDSGAAASTADEALPQPVTTPKVNKRTRPLTGRTQSKRRITWLKELAGKRRQDRQNKRKLSEESGKTPSKRRRRTEISDVPRRSSRLAGETAVTSL
ncbi:uncharacterized protein LOC129585721 [Paramacrobiotus metropolitanus]|uniref:uncharacterized protein LOC129585721 n=1 Tax=Paramacrobiotus metropolitanus TaxID=2943436 RepID=UPI0024465B7A|nr:uncharacterized protein LOC129585721 [Paramacrobiotus metropolitanus]